ncbi:hypothetical protein CYMTET_37477 [Cymbomonas tetramitiformis]|uniref:START domain-containing protein n=1 Tax=Cymbomonas tetramitiformis TaxID=36881 RepID=A0AAE0CFM2_9CHLO|nr:hypothetical protein CYMTET_37477 [Cymbomonas tetramitiformis]
MISTVRASALTLGVVSGTCMCLFYADRNIAKVQIPGDGAQVFYLTLAWLSGLALQLLQSTLISLSQYAESINAIFDNFLDAPTVEKIFAAIVAAAVAANGAAAGGGHLASLIKNQSKMQTSCQSPSPPDEKLKEQPEEKLDAQFHTPPATPTLPLSKPDLRAPESAPAKVLEPPTTEGGTPSSTPTRTDLTRRFSFTSPSPRLEDVLSRSGPWNARPSADIERRRPTTRHRRTSSDGTSVAAVASDLTRWQTLCPAPTPPQEAISAGDTVPLAAEWKDVKEFGDLRRCSSFGNLPMAAASAGVRFVRNSFDSSNALEWCQRNASSALESLRNPSHPKSLPRIASGSCLHLGSESTVETRSIEPKSTSPPKPAWANLIPEQEMRSIESELNVVPGLAKCPEDEGWEEFFEKSTDTVTYTAWKKPWKNGLYAYKSATVVKGVSGSALRAFQNDDDFRPHWDENVLEYTVLGSTEVEGNLSKLEYWRSKFPRPMAQREYVFSRKDWPGEVDGESYSLCRSCPLPSDAEPESKGRAVRVPEYYVGHRIIDHSTPGQETPAALMVIYCYEDNGVGARMINMTLKGGLWGFVQKHEEAMRKWISARPADWKPPKLQGTPVRRAAASGSRSVCVSNPSETERGSTRPGGDAEADGEIDAAESRDSEQRGVWLNRFLRPGLGLVVRLEARICKNKATRGRRRQRAKELFATHVTLLQARRQRIWQSWKQRNVKQLKQPVQGMVRRVRSFGSKLQDHAQQRDHEREGIWRRRVALVLMAFMVKTGKEPE